ncbi:MAG: S8 family serine peptidase [Elusimicrobia bacterium]|nr:S8 family serine peptidase [Elusimicrobiota bacterium]
MARKIWALILVAALAVSGAPGFAQVSVAPVEIPASAIGASASAAAAVPMAAPMPAFQSQMTTLVSLHAAQLNLILSQPSADHGVSAAIAYLDAQKKALPADAQAATAQLASLAVVSRAIADPQRAALAAADAGVPSVAQPLAALGRALAASSSAKGAPQAYASLVQVARKTIADTEPAFAAARLFDGSQTGADTTMAPAAVKALPPGMREKVMQLQKAQDAARAAAQKIQKKGMELQAWGVPSSISVDQEKYMRYARLYSMNGMPTELGAALHETLSPLVEKDPAILKRITQAQLHEAVQLLKDSLVYRMSPQGGEMQAHQRLMVGARFDEGYDYPEWREAYMEKARAVLQGPPAPGDALAGLGPTKDEQRPAAVMLNVLKDTVAKYKELQDKIKNGEAKKEEIKPVMELLLAMHAAMGIPIQTENGAGMLSLTHAQLQPIVQELTKRQVAESVLAAVMRSFPLGESLYRLGAHKLWARGLTGKGIKVAVVDNGVDFSHPDLRGSGTVFENFTRDRGDHTKGGHGTPMASIIHAIAPDAEIQSYQAWSNADLPGVVLNEEESLKATLAAMDAARKNGADIINMSGGFTMGYGSDKINKKIKELTDAGIVVIISAGNEGDKMPSGMQVRSPATSPEAIAVGAVDYHGQKAAFSSKGPVFNPKDFTLSDKPDIYAYGVNTKAAAQLPASIYEAEPAPYFYVSGTSPAAPHVSGVAAAMLQAAKEAVPAAAGSIIPAAVKTALAASAERIARLPVMQDAVKAVDAFVSALKPTV